MFLSLTLRLGALFHERFSFKRLFIAFQHINLFTKICPAHIYPSFNFCFITWLYINFFPSINILIYFLCFSFFFFDCNLLLMCIFIQHYLSFLHLHLSLFSECGSSIICCKPGLTITVIGISLKLFRYSPCKSWNGSLSTAPASCHFKQA